MRSIWSGNLCFGLVNVGVSLYTATEDKTVKFNELDGNSPQDRVGRKNINKRTNQEVSYRDIVKGYDTGNGQYVVVGSDELSDLFPENTKQIEISSFVPVSAVDPTFYEKTYYLAPERKQAAAAKKPYRLLMDAMRQEGRVGIASFVFHNRSHVVVVEPSQSQDVLVMHTLYYEDEVRDSSEISSLPTNDMNISEREMAAARFLIQTMETDTFDHSAYQDIYRESVMQLIEAKKAGNPPPRSRTNTKTTKTFDDLAAALEASAKARSK